MTQHIGIHDIAFATGHYALDLADLARVHGVAVDKFRIGLGQQVQTVAAPDEDIVTLATAAGQQILARHGSDGIQTILLATESGIDASKAAAIYVQDLLGLPNAVRAVELKQACYGGTAALHLAAALVARDPNQRVLVIASDVAAYDLDSGGEATQGAAAVAMLVTADPAVAVLDPVSGLFTSNVMDFWRPTYRSTPRVDGKLSVAIYLDAVEHAWKDYEARGGHRYTDFGAFCYHQPFTRMAYKAHSRLLEINGCAATPQQLDADLLATTHYNRMIGNSYTASLYLGLMSLLDHTDDLTGKPVAMLSYGSGCVAEFFSVTPVSGYREHLRAEANRAALADRRPISYDRYRALRESAQTGAGGDVEFDAVTTSGFRLSAVTDDKRIYQPVAR
ncbi:hydroxymethylglutaryl-CoA synthase [Nocardia sp. NPDC020380]|uniref:hydroxymethylglutaryl-CoA synthase n=1 Tax=Nocardia sp. NPDC020380 TaxID=3364309 RepID=UPI0037AF3C2F